MLKLQKLVKKDHVTLFLPMERDTLDKLSHNLTFNCQQV